MSELAAFAAVTSGLTTAISIGRAVIDAKEHYDAAAFRLKLADMMLALADAKTAMAEVQDELRAKDDTIRALQDTLKLRGDVVKHGNAYWMKDAAGKPTGDPYCIACWDKDHRLCHLANKTYGA
jgi:hypothetical protein